MSRFSVFFSLLFIMASFSCFEMIAGVTNSRDANMMLLVQRQLGNTPSAWKGGDPCGSEWDGVFCTGSRITSLFLSSIKLKGRLPDEIGLLSALHILDVSWNPGLTGPIPSSFGKLQQLRMLFLAGCSFNGRIPQELGNLRKLFVLDVNSNGLSGSIPPSLGNLTELIWLDIANNSIGGQLPVELKGLVNCFHFHFNKNRLNGPIPPEIFHENMALIHVLFDGNLLTGEIPSTLGNVSKLQILRLDRNYFGGTTPSSIRQLGQLNELRLSNNQLNGYIPDLTEMSDLQYLDLSHNPFQVSDVSTWLSALGSLNTIVMENSNLNGQIPSEVLSLPLLETLRLSNNSINGPLLFTERNVSQQLQLIDLRYNNIRDFSLGESYKKTLVLEGNPVCDSQQFISNSPICHPKSIQEVPYETNMTQCKNHVTCPEDFPTVDPRSCECALAYVCIMVFRAPTFSDLTNTIRFKNLEDSLWTQLNLTNKAVYICCMSFDADGYLHIQVRFFPAPGRKYFERLQLVKLVYGLNSRTCSPPAEFGPYHFQLLLYGDSKSRRSLSSGVKIGIGFSALVLIFSIIALGIYALRQTKKAGKAIELSNPFASWASASGEDGGDAPKLKGVRFFSSQELKLATNNFSEDNEIGSGGYGKVYAGMLLGGEMVAVKRAKKGLMQCAAEFKTELELLSRVHHKNLLGLIGFCLEEGSKQTLVYEYMSNGSLTQHLHGKTGIPLDWRKRSCIGLGTARGLAYLHEHADPPIIHRDVKSSNILLDENMNAKVSDFGLSKLFADTGNRGYVSTQVKGTAGYLDPEYYVTLQLTHKSDVYSFGVVLMEILASRPPIVEREKYLVQEMKNALEIGGINAVRRQLLDPFLKDSPVSPTVLESFVSLAMRCVENSPVDRPKMSDVVKQLESIVESLGGPYDA